MAWSVFGSTIFQTAHKHGYSGDITKFYRAGSAFDARHCANWILGTEIW